MLVYGVRGLLERAPQVVFQTELTCLIISIIYRSRRSLQKNRGLPSVQEETFEKLHEKLLKID